MKGHYIDGPFGQVHFRSWGDLGQGIPLVCLPPSPFSSVAYHTIAPLLVDDHPVIAIDYPGYGNSQASPQAPKIFDYAAAAAAVIRTLPGEQPANLLGFHTGCLVAVETALQAPEQVNHVVMTDSPFFAPAKRAELLEKMGKPIQLSPNFSGLQKDWDFCITKRLEQIPLTRAFQMFVDHISAGENTNAAFAAAFQYPCEERFAALTHECTVIATSAGLYEQSINTAQAITQAQLVELTEIQSAVLDRGAPLLAKAINKLLAA